MGIYLNPGSDRYEEALRTEIYVDKTNMISFLNSVVNTKRKYVAVSRPRRFGKTTTADMISAYYDCSINARDLFEDKKISTNPKLYEAGREGKKSPWDIYLNKFYVIHVNMVDLATETGSIPEMLFSLEKAVMRELREEWPNADRDMQGGLRLLMQEIYNREKARFVIVIDEWDCIFREFKEDTDGQRLYLDFLRDWLKDKSYIALAYITGILPIKKYGQHSALNMFGEYSMLQPQQLAEYVGFTDEEVRELCEKHGRSYDDIKAWYDGYDLYGIIPPGEKEPEEYQIYNPYSVVQAVITGRICDYWNATETYEALSVHINRNFDGLKDMVMLLMEGKRIPVNTRKYQNDMSSMANADDVLTLLIHLGYLAYDSERRESYIPNREILDEYRNTVEGNGEWDQLYSVLARSQKLLEATWAGDEDEVARLVEDAHMRAGNLTYNSEAALSYAVRLAYFNAEQYYTLIPEMQAGRGYADLAYIPSPKYPDKPAILVELKWNKDAETAMTQILDRRYPDSLEKYRGNIILVAIDYNKEVTSGCKGYKHHSCRIGRA
jgi:hypothetical protein